MLNALVLFAPLLAGYIFSVTWNSSRYRSAREDSQRLYFRAAFYGVFLATCGFLSLINIKLYLPAAIPSIAGFVTLALPSVMLKVQQDGVVLIGSEWTELIIFAALTLAWGSGLGFVLNRGTVWLWRIRDIIQHRLEPQEAHLTGWRRSLKRLIEEVGDDLEMVLFKSIDRTAPIQVTMQNRKIYVGTVVEIAEPNAERKYLKILPLLSGYREESDGA